MTEADLGNGILSGLLYEELVGKLGEGEKAYFRSKSGLMAKVMKPDKNQEEIFIIISNIPLEPFSSGDLAVARVQKGRAAEVHYLNFVLGSGMFADIDDPDLFGIIGIGSILEFIDKSERFEPEGFDWEVSMVNFFDPVTHLHHLTSSFS